MHAARQSTAKDGRSDRHVQRSRLVRVDLVQLLLVLGRPHTGVNLVFEHECKMSTHKVSLVWGELCGLRTLKEALQPEREVTTSHRSESHAIVVPMADTKITRLHALTQAEAARVEIEAAFIDVMRAYDGAAELAEAQELSRRRADEIWALYMRLTEGPG